MRKFIVAALAAIIVAVPATADARVSRPGVEEPNSVTVNSFIQTPKQGQCHVLRFSGDPRVYLNCESGKSFFFKKGTKSSKNGYGDGYVRFRGVTYTV